MLFMIIIIVVSNYSYIQKQPKIEVCPCFFINKKSKNMITFSQEFNEYVQ